MIKFHQSIHRVLVLVNLVKGEKAKLLVLNRVFLGKNGGSQESFPFGSNTTHVVVSIDHAQRGT